MTKKTEEIKKADEYIKKNYKHFKKEIQKQERLSKGGSR